MHDDLVARFNAQAFTPDAAEGTPEDGPDFDFPLFAATGNVEGKWVEVIRKGRGNLPDEVEWICDGEEQVKVRYVPIGEFEWTDDYSYLRTLTCRNHRTAKYLTKNPFFRRLSVIQFPEGDIKRSATGECTCPFSDLVVVVEASQPPISSSKGGDEPLSGDES